MMVGERNITSVVKKARRRERSCSKFPDCSCIQILRTSDILQWNLTVKPPGKNHDEHQFLRWKIQISTNSISAVSGGRLDKWTFGQQNPRPGRQAARFSRVYVNRPLDNRQRTVSSDSLDVTPTRPIPLWFSHEDVSPFLQIGKSTHSHLSFRICSSVYIDPRSLINPGVNTLPLFL